MKRSIVQSATTELGQRINDKQADALSLSRRKFMAKSALLGITTGTVAPGLNPTTAFAEDERLLRAGISGFQPLEVNSAMSKWKKPLPLDFVTATTKRFGYRNWQSGNDDSVYYNLNIPTFFNCKVVMPPDEFSVLKRDIRRNLLNVTFKAHDGKATAPLKDYLVGPRQVQAMMMAHKGRVVFEIYPGMNPTDMHVWMSASKTTAGLLATMLWEEGKLDFDKLVPTYVPELKGTAWDKITMKNAMNMATGARC